MIMNLNWNKERFRTRDRLLEYDSMIMPLTPHSAGLSIIYPWEDVLFSGLAHQLFLIAQKNGYDGDEQQFIERFSNGDSESTSGIDIGAINTFPVPGKENYLYLDKETEILYYFKIAEKAIAANVAEQNGAVIVGTEGNQTYLYIPIRALPIEPLIIDCGTSID